MSVLSVSQKNNTKMDIHALAETGKLKEIKDLLKKNPKLVNAQRTYFNDTPLHAAASKGKLTVVKYLLSKGANVNAVDSNYKTPLHNAAIHHYKASKNIARVLLLSGASIDTVDNKGRSPSKLAENLQNIKVVKVFNLFINGKLK